MITLLRTLLLLVLPWIATSCYDCGPMGEPLVNISLSPRNQLVRVSALGAKSDSLFNRGLSEYGYHGLLPISLLQDSTTFLFYFPDRVDTLTLYYERVFDLDSQCGFYNDVKAPKRGPNYRTTFKEVNVEYHSYLGPTSISNPGLSGIFVCIHGK